MFYKRSGQWHKTHQGWKSYLWDSGAQLGAAWWEPLKRGTWIFPWAEEVTTTSFAVEHFPAVDLIVVVHILYEIKWSLENP